MKKKLESYVSCFSENSVVVLGDLMLDRYLFGRATRISQEAPVPVVLVQEERTVPGGAANVARNVLSLKGHAELMGICGKDFHGEQLLRQLQDAGVGTRGVLVEKGRPTTVKTRVLASNQQVVRIDEEQTAVLSERSQADLLKQLEKMLKRPETGALILEDYAKGVFSEAFMQKAVDLAAAYGKISALDPHPKGNFKVRGLTLMTPNRAEAFSLAGMEYESGAGCHPLEDKSLARVAERLLKDWQVKYLLITLGGDGMALFQKGKKPSHIPTEARQVFDVSGAGDTVMGTMVLALLSGASVEDAARIANSAAGVVVGRVGTSAIEADVLQAVLRKN